MKKIITLVIVASLALTIQAQDIKNKLATGGEFELLNSSDQILFKVHNTGWAGTTGEFEFNSYDGGSTIVHISDHGHNNKLYFDYSNGTVASPASVVNGNSLGLIFFNGLVGGSYQSGAIIRAEVSGTVSGTTMPTDIQFGTQATGTVLTRMIIKSDGKIGIGTIIPNSTLQVAGSITLPVSGHNADYTLTDRDYTVLVNSTSTITLPSPVGTLGRIYIIKKGAGTNTVTIESTGFAIDAFNGIILAGTDAYSFIQVQSAGGIWLIIGGKDYTSI